MDYYELKLTLLPNTEVNRDVVSSLLVEIGFESFIESGQGLDAFIPEKFYSEKKIAEALKKFPLPDTHIQYQIVYKKSQDWNEEWERNFFHPIIIDNQVVIHGSFHKNIPKLQYEIVIDPKMAFGTGHHSTTELMISCLLELDLKGKSFLDIGCGTAVLAILAKKKGASPVTAVDIDEWAYENSLENIRLNHTLDITVKLGDATSLGREIYDVIFANINRNILLNDIPVYASCMHSGSSLFMSGFYQDDLAIIEEVCKKHQLQLVSYKEKDNWVAVHFKDRKS
jgi:ribosomal protein L11 methyltransferase